MDQCKTNQNPSRIILIFFCRQMAYLKFIWKDRRTKITSFGKEDKAIGLTLSDFKSYYKTTEIRTVWYCDVVKRQTRDSGNRRESPEIDQIGQLVFDKGANTIQWRKKNIFNCWCSNNWTSICKNWTSVQTLHLIQK